MPTDPSSADHLIEQSAVLGVRFVAWELLDKTAQAREHLGPAMTPEAVHDFRVALRRLRSWERAFRPELESSVSRKVRRQLKALAQAANPSRDTAVHLEWLREQLPTLTPSEHQGVAWLIESLTHAIQLSDAEFLAVIDRYFAVVYRRLRRGLKSAPTKKMGWRAPRLGDVVARRMVEQAEIVRERLATVRTAADWPEIHKVRIAGKRLRYILEPIAPYVSAVDPIVEHLKRLQDIAGDLHDVHVFANDIVAAAQMGAAAYARQLTLAVVKGDVGEAAQAQRENPTPGVLAIAGRLRERGVRGFETLSREWSGGMGDELVGLVGRVADSLRRC